VKDLKTESDYFKIKESFNSFSSSEGPKLCMSDFIENPNGEMCINADQDKVAFVGRNSIQI